MKDELRRVPVFADLAEDELAWLAEHGELKALEPGKALFYEGDPAEVMFVVLEGEFRARREKGPPDGRLFVRKRGQVGGMLPYSRITHFPVTGRAVVPTRLACFKKALFPEMLARIPVLESRLVAVMADRVRETAHHDQQRERLAALGKLSAGLAHELNNPAAAVQRSTRELRGRLQELGRLALGLAAADLSREQLQALEELKGSARPSPLDAIARGEAEEALAEWLEERGVERSWMVAETLVEAGLGAEALQAALGRLPKAALPEALAWLESTLAAAGLLNELEESAKRISELIAAVKAYTHMDRAPDKSETDIHEGIDNTLTVLAHKLRPKGVTVRRDYAPDLPRILAYAGELNQVWTNLIDNAIDAVAPGGEIRIHTRRDGEQILVQVRDNGTGIPPEIQARIFEPFFTTKEVGQGSGIGLDIVHRIVENHRGMVRVESSPGDTLFEVELPIGSELG